MYDRGVFSTAAGFQVAFVISVRVFDMFDFSAVRFMDLVGVAGCALYILNYSLLTVRRMYGDSLAYFGVNLAAAACVLFSLAGSFNLAAAVIQCFWIFASLLAIGIRLTRSRGPGWEDG